MSGKIHRLPCGEKPVACFFDAFLVNAAQRCFADPMKGNAGCRRSCGNEQYPLVPPCSDLVDWAIVPAERKEMIAVTHGKPPLCLLMPPDDGISQKRPGKEPRHSGIRPLVIVPAHLGRRNLSKKLRLLMLRN